MNVIDFFNIDTDKHKFIKCLDNLANSNKITKKILLRLHKFGSTRSIINIFEIADIINSINDKELNNICTKYFNNLFVEQNNTVIIDLNIIVEKFIKSIKRSTLGSYQK